MAGRGDNRSLRALCDEKCDELAAKQARLLKLKALREQARAVCEELEALLELALHKRSQCKRKLDELINGCASFATGGSSSSSTPVPASQRVLVVKKSKLVSVRDTITQTD